VLGRATERYPSSSKRGVHRIDIRHSEADVIDARRIAKQAQFALHGERVALSRRENE